MTDLWHQLVLIWIHNPARFQEYLAEMAPIVSGYGGAADQIFTPTAIQADGLTTPDAVNLVHYDSRTAFDAFSADPEFLKIKHLRDTSVDLRTFDGRLTQANPTRPGTDRVYLIEIGHAPRARRTGPDQRWPPDRVHPRRPAHGRCRRSAEPGPDILVPLTRTTRRVRRRPRPDGHHPN